MKELILDTIPDNYNPKKHVALGVWCFLGKESFVDDWSRVDIGNDPFDQHEDMVRASAATSALVHELLPRLSFALNNELGTSYSLKYWRILLVPWLLYLIQCIYERQLRLSRFIADRRGQRFRVKLKPSFAELPFSDTLDFVTRGVLCPKFNRWIFSLLLRRMAPRDWYVEDIPVECTLRGRNLGLGGGVLESVKKIAVSKLRFLEVRGIRRPECALWSILLSIKPDIPKTPVSYENPAATKIKLEIDPYDLAWMTLPAWVRNRRIHNRVVRQRRNRWTVVGPALMYNETIKREIAHRIESGESVAVVQHGGNYGTLKSVPLLAETEYRCDAVITWGWSEQESYHGRFIPLPSPQLRPPKKRKRANTGLIVGTEMMGFTLRLETSPQANQWLPYRNQKLEFFKSVSKEVRSSLIYRPYPGKRRGLEDVGFLESNGVEVKKHTGRLEKALLRAKVVIVDHPITTFAFCMAANIPTVAFWSEEMWGFARQASGIYKQLEAAKIIHHSPKGAAIHLSSVWQELDDWWKGCLLQEARAYWCEKYARSRRNWRWEWSKTLWSL